MVWCRVVWDGVVFGGMVCILHGPGVLFGAAQDGMLKDVWHTSRVCHRCGKHDAKHLERL